MVYKVRAALVLVLIVMLVLGAISLRQDLHKAKAAITSAVGQLPVAAWGYAVSGMKHLYESLSAGTAQYLSGMHNIRSANSIQNTNSINSA